MPRDSKNKTKRYGQRAFRYVAPSLWNALPGTIKERDSLYTVFYYLEFLFFNYWFLLLVLPAIMMVVVAIVLLWCVWCMCVFPHLCILWLHVLCMIMFFSSSVYPEEVSVGCAFVQLFCLYSFKHNVHCVHLVLALWTCTFCVEFLYAPYY